MAKQRVENRFTKAKQNASPKQGTKLYTNTSNISGANKTILEGRD